MSVAKTKELFSLIELPFYLAYGTLLGAVRDHALIPGDEDVDVFILNEQTLFNNLPFLYQNGFKVCRIIAGCLYSFRVNENSYIDVYILKPYKFAVWGLTCYSLCKYATPKKYFREYSEIDFWEILIYVLKIPKNYLNFGMVRIGVYLFLDTIFVMRFCLPTIGILISFHLHTQLSKE